MWPNLLDHLSPEVREELRANGIDRQLIHAWKKGTRLPTEVQVVVLAAFAKVDRHQLQDEIAVLRATPEQRKLLERVMGKARGVVATVIFGVTVAVAGAALGLSLAGPNGPFFRRR